MKFNDTAIGKDTSDLPTMQNPRGLHQIRSVSGSVIVQNFRELF